MNNIDNVQLGEVYLPFVANNQMITIPTDKIVCFK